MRKPRPACVIFALVSLPMVQCGFSGTPNHGGTSGPTSGTTSGPTSGTTSGPTSGTLSSDGPNCGLSSFKLNRLPPDVLIVQDRSGSMVTDEVTTCGQPTCPDKWTSVSDAVQQIVTATQSSIRWGLTVFPDSSASCSAVTGAKVPITENNASAIIAAYSTYVATAGGNTPTTVAMKNAVAYMKTLTDPNPKFILLATDGQPNCLGGTGTASDAAAAEEEVGNALSAGFPTYVVGLSISSMATSVLNAMATNGGRPRAADPQYYPAGSTTELVEALKIISGQIVGCTFTLASAPPDPTNVAVDADGKRVPRSTTNGWEFGASDQSIEFSGSYCTSLKSGAITNVQAIFGCPGQVIP